MPNHLSVVPCVAESGSTAFSVTVQVNFFVPGLAGIGHGLGRRGAVPIEIFPMAIAISGVLKAMSFGQIFGIRLGLRCQGFIPNQVRNTDFISGSVVNLEGEVDVR